MKKFLSLFALLSLFFISGCISAGKLPSEDLEALDKCEDIIKILRNPSIPANSKEKYEAAKELNERIDLHFTRETATVDKFFYHRDGFVDGLTTETPVFTFLYQYGDKFIRFRFFTCRMFITRVEIREND